MFIKSRPSGRTAWCWLALWGAAIVAVGPAASAQDGSLLRAGGAHAPRGAVVPSAAYSTDTGGADAATGYLPPPAPAQYGSAGVPLSAASWTYQPPQPNRIYEKNDIVTIRVDEISQLRAEGNSESRRNALYDALLKDWIRLDGLDLKPAPQSDGDPRVQGSMNQLYRADATLESRESLTFNIAARIVDIRPNGDLVLEARKSIVVNENVWETALSGICRPQDIAPDNVVLSRDLLDLSITKHERGRLRDGYKRGWFTRWFETLAPF